MIYKYNEDSEENDISFFEAFSLNGKSLYDEPSEFSFMPTDMESLANETKKDTNDGTEMKTKSSNKTKKSNSKIKSIHKDHRKRVRDKFFKFGLSCFSEYEVLEFLLFHSIPLKDTNEIAHRLIEHFGSLEGVFNAEYYDLMEVNGISEVSAGLISLFRQISQYLRTTNKEGELLNTAHKAGKFCCDYFASHVEENSIIIVLDENQAAKVIEVISEGSETETGFYPRKIIKSIIKHRATKVILAHNHPNKNPNPSNNDIHNTKVLAEVLKTAGIQLIDHIVCGGERFVSMADRGFLIH